MVFKYRLLFFSIRSLLIHSKIAIFRRIRSFDPSISWVSNTLSGEKDRIGLTFLRFAPEILRKKVLIQQFRIFGIRCVQEWHQANVDNWVLKWPYFVWFYQFQVKSYTKALRSFENVCCNLNLGKNRRKMIKSCISLTIFCFSYDFTFFDDGLMKIPLPRPCTPSSCKKKMSTHLFSLLMA